jgi:hypothetical protein
MLRKPIAIEMYEGVYDFLTKSDYREERFERQDVFNKLYPIDPAQDIIPEGKLYPSLFERVERHTDAHGDGTVFAHILQHLDGEYLLDIRANVHESMFVVTKLENIS